MTSPQSSPRLSPRALWRALCLVFLAAAFTGDAPAAPRGEQVVNGSASFSRNGTNTTITASNRAIINYQGFGIAANESVRFIQPGSQARVLNRVVGPDPSVIAGRLSANGRVYIVNPSGVYFSQGCLVNVGGLYAAAGALSNRDFLNNVNHFTNLTGAVVNNGAISGQSVTLAGKHVENNGAITAGDGFVLMAAGKDVYMVERGGRVYAKVTPALAGPENAASPALGLGAADAYAVALRNTGTIQARDVTLQSARGVTQVSGTIDASNSASGATGGSVKVLGENVALTGATIDVSGAAGGGTVLIGGDLHGANAGVPNAQRTYVSADTTIKADALERGDGGKVVVWGNDATAFYGSISARGGAQAGDGGLVEVSGKQLIYQGRVNTLAPQGKAGTLLLDPTNIDVVNTSYDPIEVVQEVGSFLAPDYHVGGTNLDVGLINAAATNVVLQATNDITFDAAVNIAASGIGLTAQAGNNIAVNASITTDGGFVTLSANDPATPGGPTGTGSVAINAPIATNGGDFSSSGVNFTSSTAGGISTGGGNVEMDGHTGAVSISAPVATGGGYFTSSGTTFNNSGGAIDTRNTDGIGAEVALDHSGAVVLAGNITAPGATVFISAGNGITEAGNAAVTAGALALSNGGATGDISLNNPNNVGTLAAYNAAPGGAISFNNGANALALGYAGEGAGIATTGDGGNTNSVTLQADALNLNGRHIYAPGSLVNLMPYTNGVDISLGGSLPFNVTSADLAAIQAAGIQVGGDGLRTTAGHATVGAFSDVAIPGASDLAVYAGDIQGGAGRVTGDGGRLFLVAANGIGNASPVLTAMNGAIIFQNNVAGAIDIRDLHEGGSPVMFTGMNNSGNISIEAGGDQGMEIGGTHVATSSGDIVLTADRVLFTGYAAVAPDGHETVRPYSPGCGIQLGGADPGNCLYLQGAVFATATIGGITLGRNDPGYYPAVVLDSAAFACPVTIWANGNSGGTAPIYGTITVNGQVNDAGGGVALMGSGHTTTLNGSISANGPILISDNVLVGASASLATTAETSGAAPITITGRVGALSPEGASLSLDAGRSGITLDQAVSGLTQFSATAAETTLYGDVTTSGAQTWQGALSIADNLTLTGGSVALNGPVDSFSGGPYSLTLVSSGGSALGGPVGSSAPLSALTVTGPAAIGGGLVRTEGNQTYAGPVTLTADTAFDTGGGDLRFASLNGNGCSLTLDAGIGAGTTTVTGAVNNLGSAATTSPFALYVDSGVTGLVRFGSPVAANSGLFADAGTNLEFDGDVTLAGGFAGTALNGNTLLRGSGDGALNFSVPSSAVFNALTVSGGPVVIGASSLASSPMVSVTTLTVRSDLTMNAGFLSLGTVGGDGASDLTLNGLSVGLGASVTGIHDLTVGAAGSGSGGIFLPGGSGETQPAAGVIQTTGTQTYNLPVYLMGSESLTSGGSNVTFNGTINASGTPVAVLSINAGATGDVALNGNVGTGASAESGLYRPMSLIIFAHDISLPEYVYTSMTAGGQFYSATGVIAFHSNYSAYDFTVNTNRDTPPTTATITKSGGDVVINAANNFTMSQNDKLSDTGNVQINAGSRAVVGDLYASGAISVSAPSIEIQTRAPGQVLTPQGGIVSDTGVQIVGSSVAFSTTPTVVGGQAEPVYASSTGQVTNPGAGYVAQYTPTVSDFGSGNLTPTVPAGTPLTPTTAVPTVAIGGSTTTAGPATAPLTSAELAGSAMLASRGPAVATEEAGVDTSRVTTAQMNEVLSQGAFARVSNFEEMMQAYEARSAQEGTGRGADVKAILAAYRALCWKDIVNPQTRQADSVFRANEIKKMFAEAAEAYRSRTGGFDAAKFRQFLLSGYERSGEARPVLAQLDGLLRQIEGLGFTPAELAVCKNFLFRDVRPATITTRDFEYLVRGMIRGGGLTA